MIRSSRDSSMQKYLASTHYPVSCCIMVIPRILQASIVEDIQFPHIILLGCLAIPYRSTPRTIALYTFLLVLRNRLLSLKHKMPCLLLQSSLQLPSFGFNNAQVLYHHPISGLTLFHLHHLPPFTMQSPLTLLHQQKVPRVLLCVLVYLLQKHSISSNSRHPRTIRLPHCP